MLKRKLWLPGVAFWSSLAILLFMTQGFASAAGNGLRVSPVVSNLTVSPGSEETLTINVTNVTTEPATFEAIVNDFTASSNETGDPELILGANSFAPTHSLKHFIEPIPNITIQAGQEVGVPVTIDIPKGTAGGGYYGAVRFAPASEGTGNQTVTLSGSVGSLILVKVPGNIVNKMSIAGFSAASSGNSDSFFTSNKNIDAIIRFQNEGNVQEQPFGKVALENHSNKTLSDVEVNNVYPPGNVLPDSIREFSVPVKNIGSFGIYKLEGNFGYGSNGQLLSASTTFYVVPAFAIVLFVLIVILLLFLIFGLPKLIHSYNQRVIRQASRRRSL
jgi:hypothetical protein